MRPLMLPQAKYAAEYFILAYAFHFSAVLFGLLSIAFWQSLRLAPHSCPMTFPTQKYLPSFPPSNNFLQPSTTSKTFRRASLVSLSLRNFLSLRSSLLCSFPLFPSSSSIGMCISSTPRRSPTRSSSKQPVTKARVASFPAKNP